MSKTKREKAAATKHKKSNTSRGSKSSRDSVAENYAFSLGHLADSSLTSASVGGVANTKLSRKQTEIARVYNLKCAMLIRGDLSYLEYQELREEICRLTELKEYLNNKATKLETR